MRCTTCQTELEADALYCGLCGRRTRKRHDSAIGMMIDDTYRVDEKIAVGGFGAIYRATHLASRSTLALKVLHADFIAEPALAARFARESKALARLRSPHTVVTYERGEARDGTLYIAMELLQGESLYQRFQRRGAMPWREVLAMMRAVCHSLGEAHLNGIVHRDLKPANIHLGKDDFVKVLDFGVAKVLPWSNMDDGTELTLAGQAVGTLEYMAPEQLAGAECDARADIYALGVVAYEMITGRRPFPEALNAPSLITALMTQTPRVPSSICPTVPALVDQILMCCLEREASDRFSTAQQLVAAIDRAVARGSQRDPWRAVARGSQRDPRRALARPAMKTVSSGGGLQPVEVRHVAFAPTLACQPEPERKSMPAFDLPVRGTRMDALPCRPHRWLFWILGLSALLAGMILGCLV